MPYRLKTGESVETGMRRLLAEQVERALAELADTSREPGERVHQVRKRCKKIRAALRLVRPALGKTYARENARFRDAARLISTVRDIDVMIQTCQVLADHFDDPLDREAIQPIRLRLAARQQVLMEDTGGIDNLLDGVESMLLKGEKTLPSLSLKGDGQSAALAGMHLTYARARTAMKAAYNTPSPETFHEWRKRVKYHWYHLRLLHNAWPVVLRARRDEADRLGKWLGDHHDLCVLRAWVLNDPVSLDLAKDLTTFVRLVDKRTTQIESVSHPLGRRLFAEKPGHLKRRLKAYCDVWSVEG